MRYLLGLLLIVLFVGTLFAEEPGAPTLSVKAIDAKTGDEISGAEVFVNGSLAGQTPLSGYRLQEGASVTVEVKGDKLTPYRETLASIKGGVNVITARMERITMRAPPGFRAAPGTTPEPYTKTGWAKEVIHEKTGYKMVFVPAGEFEMGESPSRHVRITKPFYLGQCEVTQGEWQKVTGSNPSNFKGDRNPIERVSWDDCQDFLKKAGEGFRLPTEAEWEYACRAGTTTAFCFGDTISTDQANYDGNHIYGSGRRGIFRGRTVEVGSFPPNAWGLYDMHGNVWEWCADWYGSYPSGTVDDPDGPSSGRYRVLRGGGWDSDPDLCRSAGRGGSAPSSRYYVSSGCGVRLAIGL